MVIRDPFEMVNRDLQRLGMKFGHGWVITWSVFIGRFCNRPFAHDIPIFSIDSSGPKYWEDHPS